MGTTTSLNSNEDNHLSNDEMLLLSAYRVMNKEDKKEFLNTINMMVEENKK